MDQDHLDGRPPENGVISGARNRRKFLQHVGMTAAAATAIIGVTDVVGVKSAFGATTASPMPTGKVQLSALPASHAKRVQAARERYAASSGSDPEVCCFISEGQCGHACRPTDVYCTWCYNYGTGSAAYNCAGHGSAFSQCWTY